MDDYRLDWMKHVTYNFLDISNEDNSFFDFFDGNDAKHIYSLFAESRTSPQCIFFYKTIEEAVEEDVESLNDETVMINPLENETRPTIRLPSVDNTLDENMSSNTAEPKITENSDKSKDENFKIEAPITESQKDATDDQVTNLDTIPAHELRISRSKTSVQKITLKVVLHLCLNVTTHTSSRQYVYFFKKQETVPFIDTVDLAFQLMPQFFEIGLINKHPLVSMDKLLASVYFPLFVDESFIIHILAAESKGEIEVTQMFNEFCKVTKEFTVATKEAVTQIEKPFLFHLPVIPAESNDELIHDFGFMSEVEECVEEWVTVMSDLIDEKFKMEPDGQSLLSEIQFWKEKKSSFSVCYLQLNTSSVSRIIDIMKLANCDLSKFYAKKDDIKNQLKSASDNVNYLSLLEPNVKNLLLSSPAETAYKALDGLLVLLKLIWTQSDYYKQVANMLRLLKGITVGLKQKVTTNAEVRQLFRKPLNEVKSILKESIHLLKHWKEVYMNAREDMKKYGSLYWWTFDIRTFFEETDHLISVCQNLELISEIMEKLYNVFNTNLKHLAQDIESLNALEARVNAVTLRVQYADFEVFEQSNKTKWKGMMKVFHQEVKDLESEVISYIGKMFRSGLSFNNSAVLVQNFNKLAVPKTIKDFMNKSHEDILSQYMREICDSEDEFWIYKDESPVFQYLPKFTSAIVWVQDLLTKLAAPMNQICNHGTLTSKELEVQIRFQKVETLLKNFKLEKFEAWKVEASEKLSKFLQSNLLKKTKQASNILADHKSKLLEVGLYAIYFPNYLEDVSVEAKFLEYLQFDIPMSIRNVVLRESMYFKSRNQICFIIEEIQTKLNSMKPAEVVLLTNSIEKLNEVLDFGANRVQWDLAEIPAFHRKLKQTGDHLMCQVNQIEGIIVEINQLIQSLSHFNILKFSEHYTVIPTCEVYFGDAEHEMREIVLQMVEVHRSLLPRLLKIESVICNTSSGQAQQMTEYYRKCEHKILSALLQMMLTNLEYFHSELLDYAIFPYVKELFQSKDDLILQSAQRIRLVFVTYIGNVLKSAQCFRRWSDGTCMECPTFHSLDTQEEMEFTFYLDLILYPPIKHIVLNIMEKLFKYLDNLD